MKEETPMGSLTTTLLIVVLVCGLVTVCGCPLDGLCISKDILANQ
jgi:hypothetical protein